jgi:hypothetical protein
MPEQSPFRSPLLPIMLLTGVIFGLIFVAIRATVALPASPVNPTATFPVHTPSPALPATPTLTQTLTPLPTWTIRPTASPTSTGTPTPTPTATLHPTLTPARPLEFNDQYRLREWTPERAEQLVSLLNDYPEARFRTAAERQDPRFNEAYAYPAFAYREALLRFPDDPAAESWKYGLAYSLARNNDPEAGNVYANLILEALESGKVRINSLPGWFSAQERRLELNVIPVQTSSVSGSSVIVQISGGGGAYIWVLEDSGDFTTHPLISHFDFANDLQSGLATGDFTGDGTPEAVIFFSQTAENSLLSPPRVFQLNGTSPVELNFTVSKPFDLGTEFSGIWQMAINDNQREVLQFSARVMPACPVDITRNYLWNGEAFELESTHYQLEPEPSIVEYCEITVEHAARLWGVDVSAELMEAVLPYWPPERRADGRLYPADARDEWLYRLGVSHTLAGNPEQARSYLQEALDFPSQPESTWQSRIRDFLNTYQTEDDLYKACTQSIHCDPRAALKYITAQIPVERYERAHVDLRAAGVALRSSGLFDFNRDGEQERWLVVRHREDQNLELWILARDTENIHALFVGDAESAQPNFRYSDQVEEPPIVQLQLGEGFKLEHVPGSNEPFLSYHIVEFVPTTFTRDALEEAIEDLFSGQDPAGVLRDLENLQESQRFNCLNFRICDRFYYMLGLAYELDGREREAIDTYIKLWWENRDSPFTVMARLKLEQLIRNTPVPTQRTGTPGGYPPPVSTPTTGYPLPEPTPTTGYPLP